jgi:heptosyltransferase-2
VATTCVVAPNWLGDAVMALPALAAIRRARRDDRLLVAGRASTVPLFTMVGGVDGVIRLDSRGGIVGAISWAEDAAALRDARADVAILLPNSFRSAWTCRQAGIPERWGYAADLRRTLLTRRVPRLRGRFHQAQYYLHLVEQLGMGPAEAAARAGGDAASDASAPKALRLPRLTPGPDAVARADALLRELGLPPETTLIGLAPGAAYGTAKQWPPEYYGVLAADLRSRRGVVSLIFGASADKFTSGVVSETASIKLQKCNPSGVAGSLPAAISLAGRTDLPLLVALMGRCRSFVSNDSGAMHVAASAGVPVTAVFGASDERGTAPLPGDTPGPAPHEILSVPVWCRPCMLRECPIDHRCMRRLDPAAVAAAVERQILGSGIGDQGSGIRG